MTVASMKNVTSMTTLIIKKEFETIHLEAQAEDSIRH